MIRCRATIFLLALLPGSAAAGGAFDVGSRSQLFVDHVLVRSSTNVAFTLHPARKHPKNPLVVADRPWED
jgi:hypothetical protein